MLVLGDAGLQRLTMYLSCSLDGGQPSQTSGWRFGNTALPLLYGVPTLRGRRFGSTAFPLLFGATGSLLGRARFGSTALPLLFGVPTLSSDVGLQG